MGDLNCVNAKPLTFLDRKESNLNNRYVLISYAHVDADKVYPVLNKLYDKGINYWYDTELSAGDIWNEVVGEKLRSPDCAGIVCFVSKNSIVSSAVYREMMLANEIVSTNPDFSIIPVLVELEAYTDACMIAYEQMKSEAFKVTQEYEKFMATGSRTYLRYNDELVDKLYEECKKSVVTENNYMDTRGSMFTRLKNVSLNQGVYYLELGTYPKDGDVIEWKLVGKVNDNLIWVSQKVVAFDVYKSTLDAVRLVNDELEDYKYVTSVSVIDTETIRSFGEAIGDAVPTEYADGMRAQQLRVFWVKDADNPKNIKIYNAYNKEVKVGVDVTMMKFNAGVRLVLIMDDSQISVEDCK